MSIQPLFPENDIDRVAALHSYGILHTEAETEYDQVTELAAQITGMPISLISFVDKDKVWYKSAVGMSVTTDERNSSLCSHTIALENDFFILEDLKKSERFKNHEPIQFYAGVSLKDCNGFKLGTLCVIDKKPNSLNNKQISSLKTLATQVIKLIELHKANDILKNVHDALERKNEELKSFAALASHDMKMPLANIIVTTDILKAKYAHLLDDQAKEYLKYLKQSSFSLSDYITGLLAHYESGHLSEQNNQEFNIHHLLEEIVDLLNIDFECEINFPKKNVLIKCNRAGLEQILLNLIGNSLKYNDKELVIINIECQEQVSHYSFKISDNGIGIPKDKLNDIFTLFSTLGTTDRQGNKGNGIGLSTVKKLVDRFDGKINVTSELGKGTAFEFTIPKRTVD